MLPRFEHCLVKKVRFYDAPSDYEKKAKESNDTVIQQRNQIRELRELLDQKYTESIANLVTKNPTAKYRFYLDIPSEEHPETYSEFIFYRGAKARVGAGLVVI